MAKVVPLASAKAFLDALEKSGLVSASDLGALRSSRGEDNDPKAVARDLVKDGSLTKWQAGQLLHGFHLLMVGKYKLMDQLGSGEMGRVYLGEHAQLGRKVSLKILSRKYTANPEILKKVLEDGRKASALDHRNLSRVFDVNSEDERYYLVTEFVEGKDLKQLVEASGAISPAHAIEIVRQAAEGLEHAHSQGLTHSDLKPSNLIIDASGVVKILDLGLSRLTESTPAVGDESTEVATLAAQSFHAPEQASHREASPLADVFSLGGVLFYLLSGKPPLGKVKKAQDVKDGCAAVSDELAELCAKMLSEDPAARPQTDRQVIEGLDLAARAKPKPAVKDEKKGANGDKPQIKQKKPLVAKALEIPFPTQAPAAAVAAPAAPSNAAQSAATPNKVSADKIEEISLDELSLSDASQPAPGNEPVAAVVESPAVPAPAEPDADDPFGGFSLQTKRKKQKPALESAAASPATAATSAPPADAPVRKNPSMGIVIGAGIGGGVLILALGVTALFWALSRGGKTPDKTAIAKAEQEKEKGTPAGAQDPESNPELNPEVNPNPEENPKVETPATAKTPETMPPGAKDPPTKTQGTKEGPNATVPMPNPGVTNPPMPMPGTNPMPMPMPMVATNPPMPKPEPAKPEPAKPEPAKPEPAKPEPVKPTPIPMPEVPVGNPFVGFAKIVSLPPLEEKGKPVADATKPLSLGTIKIPAKALCLINLKGGENAISLNAKQKFVMESGNNGTSERDWEIKVATDGNNTPVLVAKLALENDQLNFQWTEEAAKQIAAAPYSSAPYLCNCVLSMSAGSGSHLLALRQPITGEPLKVDLEKPMNAKYTIDYPPNAKQIVVQLGPPEGKFQKFKFEKPELMGKNDNTMFSTGPADEVQLLHFRLICSMSTKLLKIDAQPNFKIHLMTKAEKYIKAKMAKLVPDAEAASQQALQEQAFVSANLASIPVDQRAQKEAEAKKLVEDRALQKAQSIILRDLVKDLQGEGKIHFHILYEVDSDTKVVLVSTGAAPPMAAAPMP